MKYDSSFENIDNEFTRNVQQRKVSSQRILSERIRDNNNLPTMSSATSSDRHLFSDSRRDQLSPVDSDFDDEYYYRDVVRDFKDNKDNFDQAIRQNNHVKRTSRYNSNDKQYVNTYADNNQQNQYTAKDDNLSSQFQTLLNLHDELQSTKVPILSDQIKLKHPKSMADLKTQQLLQNKYQNNNTHYQRLKNSMSYGNLRQPSKRSSVRFKRSMTGLNAHSPLKEENETNKNDTVIIEPLQPDFSNKYNSRNIKSNKYNFTNNTNFDDDYLNKFEERFDDGTYTDNGDFLFEEDEVKPQYFRNVRSSGEVNNNLDYIDIGSNLPFTNEDNNKIRSEITDSRYKNQSPTSKIRTIKQTIDYNTPLKKGSMTYNPQSMKWEGNEQALDRFANVKTITKNKNTKVVGNMILDEKQNRWVSLSGEEHDPFLDLDRNEKQTNLNKFTNIRSKSSHIEQEAASNIQQHNKRYHSLNTYNTRTIPHLLSEQPLHSVLNIKYIINSHTLEKFYHEENKWHKKVGGWFIPGSDLRPAKDNISLTSKDSKDYMYEIRKMVFNSTRN